MAYEMNEGGYLSGDFVQAQYDRNQEWQDYQRSQAAAESYWRQLKMQQEMERSADLNKLNDALTADMVPLGAEVDEYGHKRVKLGYAKEAKPVAPDVHSVSGGLAVVGPDGNPTWYQPPWATDKPAKDFTTVSGRGGHWVYNYDGTSKWVPDPAGTGGDRKKVTEYVDDQGRQVVGYDDGTKQVFDAVQSKPVPDEFASLRHLGQGEMARALISGDPATAQRAGMFLNGLPMTTTAPSPFGGRTSVQLDTAGRSGVDDALTRALLSAPPVGGGSNAVPVGASSPVAPVSSGGTVLQLGMDGSVTGAPRAFASEADAQAAAMRGELQNGDMIVVNGRRARWRN
jgi:hypothetical protein